ncbi:hypothetical protein JRQ81_004553 [Phrynocephalus forsythii]|uniref:Zona pellucida sperm-binding protein 3 n=1 Tax=Phrynocephalus forsythii TaxID=171643 RepID=A0A9Q0XFY3_9SAUR|nr:hypothetical protein JRQ81_004553 [Phrynocephalus forsythii]
MPAGWWLLQLLILPINQGCLAQHWPPAWRGPQEAPRTPSHDSLPGLQPGTPLSRGAPLRSHAVKVACEPHRVVVTVRRDFFGLGHLVAPGDLTLGVPPCPPASFDHASNEVLFEAGLHECGSSVQMTPQWLVYRTSLFYRPSLAANPVVVRTNAAEVPIECRYPRMENVSSRAIQPTWAPFRSTVSAEARLGFSLRLMTDDWRGERSSARFQLGDLLRLQADIRAENHRPLRLYVDSCVAGGSPETPSAPRYPIVDSHGCLVDGRPEGVSSTFLSPRPQQGVLRFTVDAFRWAGDAGNQIYIMCHLKVTPAEQVPDALNKACSFSAARRAWLPVEGPGAICNCCERRNCAGETLREPPRGFISPRHQPWEISGQRSLTVETERHEARLALGPIAVFDSLERVRQDHGDSAKEEMVMEEGFLPVIESKAEATGPLFPFRDREEGPANISGDQKDKLAPPLEVYLRAGPFFISRAEGGSGFREQDEPALADEQMPLEGRAELAFRSLRDAATSSPPGGQSVEDANMAARGLMDSCLSRVVYMSHWMSVQVGERHLDMRLACARSAGTMKETIQGKKYWGASPGLPNTTMGHRDEMCQPSQGWDDSEPKHGGCFKGSHRLAYTKKQPPGFGPLSPGSDEEEQGEWDLACVSSWGVAGDSSDVTQNKAGGRRKVARSGGRAWPFDMGAGSNSRGRLPLLGGPSRRQCFRRRRQRALQAFRMLLYSKSSSLAFHWKLWGKMASKGRRRPSLKRARSSLSLSPGSQPDDDPLPLCKKSFPLAEGDCQPRAKRRPHPSHFKACSSSSSEPHLDYELDGAFPPSASVPQTSRGLSLLGALMEEEASPYPQYVELQRVACDKDPGAMELDEEEATMLKYPPGGALTSPRTRKIGEALEHGLDGEGGPLDALPNGYAALTPDGSHCSLPGVADATILISNVCSIGGQAAEELFQGPQDNDRLLDSSGARLEMDSQQAEAAESAESSQERLGEKAVQHSPLGKSTSRVCITSWTSSCRRTAASFPSVQTRWWRSWRTFSRRNSLPLRGKAW